MEDGFYQRGLAAVVGRRGVSGLAVTTARRSAAAAGTAVASGGRGPFLARANSAVGLADGNVV